MGEQIKEILKNTWAIEDDVVRFFLVAGENKALMIDTGISGKDVKGIAASLTDLPVELICTHSDMDHIAANATFDTFYMHPSELPRYHRTNGYAKNIIPVYEGNRIDLGGRTLEVIHLPGHTPGSITLLDRDNRCLIGGDPIQTGGEIFMFGEDRDLLERAADFDDIYPSHGDLPVHKDVIPALIEGARRILDKEAEGVPGEIFGTPVTVYDIGIARFLCDRDIISKNTAEIRMVKGDITRISDVEAIVNAANRSLLGGGGVDGAIHRAAGPKLLAECRTLHGCDTGKAKLTNAYNLPCQYVIHTVGPVWHGGKRNEAELLADCYRNSLQIAVQKGIRRIAFPSISTGVYSYPVGEAAKIAVHTVNRFIEEHPGKLDLVEWVLFDQTTYDVYEDAKKHLTI